MLYTKEQLIEYCRQAFNEGQLYEACVSECDSFEEWCSNVGLDDEQGLNVTEIKY